VERIRPTYASIARSYAGPLHRAHQPKRTAFREAILQRPDDLEDIYFAEQALECVRSGEKRTVPLKDVSKRNGRGG
jgi:predicted DNA-binding protein